MNILEQLTCNHKPKYNYVIVCENFKNRQDLFDIFNNGNAIEEDTDLFIPVCDECKKQIGELIQKLLTNNKQQKVSENGLAIRPFPEPIFLTEIK